LIDWAGFNVSTNTV